MKPSQLRILFIMDAIQGRNGVGTYFQDLTRHLEPYVDEIELVAPNLTSPHICQGKGFPMPGDRTQKVFLPKMRELTKLALRIQPQVIVIPGPGLFALAGFWLASKLGVPVCLTHQTDYAKLVDLYWQGRSAPFAHGLLRWVNHSLNRGCAKIVTLNTELQQQLTSTGLRNVHVIGTTLAPEFIHTPLIDRPLQSVKKILFVGRLAPEKNIDQFLALAEQRPDLTFTIAGDGPLRNLVEQYRSKQRNLNVLGWCPRATVLQQLDQHDLLILPSSVEAFGTVAIEAMARGRLVLVSENCGINQWPVLANGITTMTNNEPLSAAVKRLETMPEAQQKRLTSNAVISARKLNTESINQWLDILSQCAQQRRIAPRSNLSPIFALLRRLALVRP